MLHGEIKVNNSDIVEWRAVWKENYISDVHRYECYVKGRKLDGYPFEFDFDLYHSYQDGATLLASSILAEAHSRL